MDFDQENISSPTQMIKSHVDEEGHVQAIINEWKCKVSTVKQQMKDMIQNTHSQQTRQSYPESQENDKYIHTHPHLYFLQNTNIMVQSYQYLMEKNLGRFGLTDLLM